MGVKYKAECPVCGKKVTVRESGQFWHHLGTEPEYPGSPFKKVCAGAGRKVTTREVNDGLDHERRPYQR